ncbi:molybdate ABC transporter substrate-binding protein [Virgibacillus sp. DJP39]|uniref:molybdate ABC transporter substrate-binding protein n=1 Tax=Virgibacillus sp. DJP39 TaxID=3409790 RepID=UPI003BB72FDD
MNRLITLCLLLALLVACSDSESTNDGNKKEIFIAAAASLSGALEKISTNYEEEHPNVDIVLNFSGSGKLAQQIQQGAPVDIFLSADQHWMNVLEDDNLVIPETRSNFAQNKLVLITQQENTIKVNKLMNLEPTTIGQIAIGNPKSVPAGNYAKKALTNVKMWDKLTPEFVYAKDVRQVLTYVESGNAEIGFVYGSDLYRAKNVRVLEGIDSTLYPPIVYPGAVLSTSKHLDSAKNLLAFLQSDSSQDILRNYGFSN